MIWNKVSPNLVEETLRLTREGVRNPDQLGKNRKHWANLDMRLQVRLLQERLEERQEKAPSTIQFLLTKLLTKTPRPATGGPANR